MKKWFKENNTIFFGFALIFIILIILIIFWNNTVHLNKTYKNNGWYEATIIMNGIEIVRGQIEDMQQKTHLVTVTIGKQKYTTAYENLLIIYYPYE